MVSVKIKIRIEQGLHMRPAQIFVQAMSQYPCDVTLIARNQTINGKSILSVMAAGLVCGSPVEVRCSGEREQEALERAVALLEAGPGRLD